MLFSAAQRNNSNMQKAALLLLLLLLWNVPVAEGGRPRRRRRRKKGASSPAHSATGAINADNLDHQSPVVYRPETLAAIRERRQLAVGEEVEISIDERDSFISRKLADEDWMTWEAAEAANTLGGLRVEFVRMYNKSFEFLKASEQCGAVGQLVQQNKMNSPNIAGSGAQLSCEEDEVISHGLAAVVNVRLDWVEEYMIDTFTVKQAQSGITVSQSAQAGYPFDGNVNGPDDGVGNLLCDTTLAGECPSTVYPDADLVIVVTMHPLSRDKSGIAGYASCQQSDQYGRCTVGYFEWVPDTLSVDQLFFPDVAMLERSTALHECMHVLGGIKNSQLFRDAETGEGQPNSYKLSIQIESPFIGKQIAMWKTPGVLAMAREQFNCSEIEGVPLEDLPSGANGHWESRLMGSEVMSYGLTTGEYYVSMLTLQFFEDSNQYKVNFTAGTQRIFPATGSDAQLATDIFSQIFVDSAENGKTLPNRSWPTGYQRWGRNAGCDFFQKYPSNETWGERYFCREPSANGCTGDNLMSGRCSLYQYGSDYTAASISWYARSDTPDSGWYANQRCRGSSLHNMCAHAVPKYIF